MLSLGPLPTRQQKNALAGTVGAPDVGNQFLTVQDYTHTPPIGTIYCWWPATGGTPGSPLAAPPGYEFCDGTLVVTSGSPLLGRTKPALMKTAAGGAQRFPRGIDFTVSNYGGANALNNLGADTHTHGGATGGASTSADPGHSHSYTVSGGGHSHTVNSHNHSISSDGSHAHNNPINTGNFYFCFSTSAYTMESEGAHSHGGGTGSSSPGTDFYGGFSINGSVNGAGSHSHSVGAATISSDANKPSHVELAYIVRVL